jgi:hypothetical protein
MSNPSSVVTLARQFSYFVIVILSLSMIPVGTNVIVEASSAESIIVRLGFRGAGLTEGLWLGGLEKREVFNSSEINKAFSFIISELDKNADGEVSGLELPVEIRITGFSWGGWSALRLAKELHHTKIIKQNHPHDVKIKLGLLDPVRTARWGTASIPGSVVFAKVIYQRNGCWKKRCFGPSCWYRGKAIRDTDNRNVTDEHEGFPDGVPFNKTPDHVHLLSNFRSYAQQIGMILQQD